jgi:hypothetical protein
MEARQMYRLAVTATPDLGPSGVHDRALREGRVARPDRRIGT